MQLSVNWFPTIYGHKQPMEYDIYQPYVLSLDIQVVHLSPTGFKLTTFKVTTKPLDVKLDMAGVYY